MSEPSLVCSRNYKESFKSFCISDCRATVLVLTFLSEDLITKIHLAQPQATIDDWIEAMSDENARFHRIMLEDNAQSHFDLDIAIQVKLNKTNLKYLSNFAFRCWSSIIFLP